MSNNRYSLCCLMDVANIEISGVDKKALEGECEVELCNFVDVYYNWAITKSKAKRFIKATASLNEIAKFSIKKGQVAITKDSETRYDIGISTYIADDFDKTLLGYHCALISPDEKKVNSKYLNVFLHTEFMQKYFELNATGSGQRYTLSIYTLNHAPLYLPPLEEQRIIGNLFSAIDRKIELNEKINDMLDQQMQLLYEYWFIQYEFPNQDGKSYSLENGKMIWSNYIKREIPVNWTVAKIEDLIKKVPSTTRIVTSNYLLEGDIPIIDQSSNFIAGYTNDITAKLSDDNGYIVFGDHTRVVKYINFPFARGADGTRILTSNTTRMPNKLLYQIVKNIDLSNFGYARHFKFLKETYIIVPDEVTAKKYCDLVEPMHKMQVKLIFENSNLLKMRNWLLKMLMNIYFGSAEAKISVPGV